MVCCDKWPDVEDEMFIMQSNIVVTTVKIIIIACCANTTQTRHSS